MELNVLNFAIILLLMFFCVVGGSCVAVFMFIKNIEKENQKLLKSLEKINELIESIKKESLKLREC